ncbi:integral membrane protein [Legionella rubrilucens]|uniref:Integral membrane protein n=1 Tax=Legionella rubrilucens TaxID=458 RepID=A0A0W0XRC3_9GAMM|nr:metal-dependent hydrolase [Legionella rubrilucens]KTD47055.1 integral membrane protein [Legionella rubrilucens]
MDPITQGALGAACAQMFFGRYSRHIPWQVGALAAMTADLDILFGSRSDPLRIELWHRHFTHSLAFIPAGALLSILLLMLFSYYRHHWRLVIAVSLVAYATHGLLDACTSYGTVLLWPFSLRRISWDIVSIIDPWFTVPLILGTAWSVIHQQPQAVRLGLAAAALFLVFNSVQHQRAIHLVQDYAKTHHLNLTRLRAMPELASSTRWRIIAKEPPCLFIATAMIPLWGNNTLIPASPAVLFSVKQLPFPLSPGQRRDLAVFSWFSDDYLILARSKPALVADARYTQGFDAVVSLWGIGFQQDKPHVKRMISVPIQTTCRRV